MQKSAEDLYETRYEISEDIPFTNDSSVNFLLNGRFCSSLVYTFVLVVLIRKLGLATLWMAYHLQIIKEADLDESEVLFDFDLAAIIAKAEQEGRFQQQSAEEEIQIEKEAETSIQKTPSTSVVEKEENTFSDEEENTFSDEDDQGIEDVPSKQPEQPQTDPALQKLREIQGRIELAENHFEVLGAQLGNTNGSICNVISKPIDRTSSGSIQQCL